VIEQIDDVPAEIFGVRAVGTLTAEDYATVRETAAWSQGRCRTALHHCKLERRPWGAQQRQGPA
jgi:hypothetical protein